ncbi:LytR/AlgR family response regulator transcription factor [Flammeovirga aprica]|uniref:Response regulator transcription factor n=1 Tax=Flammeovirga aprica JL-4 TaxID=694437 RepID=A0A7X9RS40_9BACT|nr:LytTR family DNA-binding domain-containing protein [Flammeovirga aprica]NME66810.1 response regulator transcription factor [Flammeovirga aprica JL-4]
MMKIRCLIVDDEILAQNILEEFIGRIDDLELIGKCNNGIEALNFLNQNEVDLVFLDIQMPLMTGTALLEALKSAPKTIFTTAYSNFALEGFELDAIDYLLKPFAFERFVKAVEKFKRLRQEPVVQPSTSSQNDKEDFLYLKENKVIIKTFLKDIIFVESAKNYVKVITKEREIVVYTTITAMMEKLNFKNFKRIHRSFIINTDFIKTFTAAYIELDEYKIPIGRNYKQEVMDEFGITL